jgi:hypothetical protein
MAHRPQTTPWFRGMAHRPSDAPEASRIYSCKACNIPFVSLKNEIFKVIQSEIMGHFSEEQSSRYRHTIQMGTVSTSS